MDEEPMEFDMDAPLALVFKRKRKSRKRLPRSTQNEPHEGLHDAEVPPLPAATAEHLTHDTPPKIVVSKFDYSVESHFKAVDTITKLCGYRQTFGGYQTEIQRLSNSVTFLREWRDFNYTPRFVRFASQRSRDEKDIIGGVTLPQFSAASVPKEDYKNGSKVGSQSGDFVMHTGGPVWALDWCPRVESNTANSIKSEFVAVAAHPPNSSYHKIGAPITGRGAIQIWCLLTVHVKEDAPSKGKQKSKSKPNTQKKSTVECNIEVKTSRSRGRPRKIPINDSMEKIGTDSQCIQPLVGIVECNMEVKTPRPRGRPRKHPINDSMEKIDTDSQCPQPLAIEYIEDSPRLHSSDNTCGNANKDVCDGGSVKNHKKMSAASKVRQNRISSKVRKNKADVGKKDQFHNNFMNILEQCEHGHGDSAITNPTASSSIDLDLISYDCTATCSSSFDANASKECIPLDVALPRMMLCLAHNGKIAWDVKWRPANARDPASMIMMGYLAVLLGNGALEVWEVPFPHTLKHVYPVGEKYIDPRFVKLKPVFKCSMLKCGDRRSIPLTVEWSVSSPYDLILAGCHDGLVALWKFSVTDSLTETRPLLSFRADTGPIRSLAWAPVRSYPENANIIVTAGLKCFKFWDIRDPFRPLWENFIPGATYDLTWLLDPRCVFGSADDGLMWLLSLEKPAHEIPITGRSYSVTPKQGFHLFECSSFALWSIQASQLTGMVAYCDEEGTAYCFQPTVKFLKDPSRNRSHHYVCGSLSEEESVLIVTSPSANSQMLIRRPGLKRSKDQDKGTKGQQIDKSVTCEQPPLAICYESDSGEGPSLAHRQKESNSSHRRSEDIGELKGKGNKDKEFEMFPPKKVAMHKVKWSANRGSQKWLCYGGAAGLLRCQEVDLSAVE